MSSIIVWQVGSLERKGWLVSCLTEVTTQSSGKDALADELELPLMQTAFAAIATAVAYDEMLMLFHWAHNKVKTIVVNLKH